MEYINLKHLKHFYAIAKNESYTKASKELNIQQPALSKTIKILEEDIGLKLFKKEGRNIKLTSHGEYVYSKCHSIFQEISEIKNYTTEDILPVKSTFHIFTNDAIATHLLPKLLTSLNFKSKNIRPVIVTGQSEHLINQMKDATNSIGLFFHTPKITPDFKVSFKIPVSFKLVILKKLKSSTSVLTSFIGSREVDNSKSNKFPVVQKMKKKWSKTKISCSSNSLLSHKALVLEGLGTSILPNFIVKKELQSGTLSSLLDEENFKFDMKIVQNKADTSDVGQLFFDELKRILG